MKKFIFVFLAVMFISACTSGEAALSYDDYICNLGASSEEALLYEHSAH